MREKILVSFFIRVITKRRVAIFLVTILVIYLGLSVLGAIFVMRIPRLPLGSSPISVGLDYEDVSFKSRDDSLLLKGWYISGNNSAAIIIIHGGFQNRVDNNVDTLGLSYALHEQGFSLLLFDLRGRGESEGKGQALSDIENDIEGAVDYLESRGHSSNNISIMGYCSGAASACIFTSQEDIGALILVGCFARVQDMVVRMATTNGIPGVLAEIFIPGLQLMTKTFYSYEVVNPVDVVANITCSILFVHEECDEFIPIEDMRMLFEASTNSANELWEIENIEHSQAYKSSPDVFIKKVTSFLNVTDTNVAQVK